jgi:lipopolysaccharide biosynthesis glycosyltransferase/tetratricopeptide (TPR) repeat protein
VVHGCRLRALGSNIAAMNLDTGQDSPAERPAREAKMPDADATLSSDVPEVDKNDVDSITELLDRADAAASRGDVASARALLDRAIQSGEQMHLAHHRRGRLEVDQADPAIAGLHFHAGIEADPNFPFNWIGAAAALHAQGRKHTALESAERFMAFGVRPHDDTAFTLLADLGDVLFDAGDRRRSLPFYDFVVRFGADQPRDAVRLAEGLIVAEDFEGAKRVLLAQQERGRLDEWGHRALALAHSRLNDHQSALAQAEIALRLKPDNDGFVGTYLDVLVRAGNMDAFRDALARLGDLLPRDAVRELSARLKLDAQDFAGAVGEMMDAEIVYQSRLYYLQFETAYKALAANLPGQAIILGERLGAVAPDDIAIKLLRIEIFFGHLMWEEAGRLLASMSDLENQNPYVILRRLEYVSFVGDTVTAQELCAVIETMVLPDRQFMLPVFRFLAERQEWQRVVDRALPWLDAHFNYPQIGYVFFRAAKNTRRQADMIATIEAVADWQNYPDLVKLRANLACDCAETLRAIDQLAHDPTVIADTGFQHRLAVKREVLARALALKGRRAVFFCTDRNYLCATIVALHTATRAVDLARTDFFVVVDEDIAGLTRAAVTAFSDLGVSVTVVPASDVVPPADKLYARYGLFTSGHLLAEAAYYRIYFARYLQDLGSYDRAVYLDSDILVRGDLRDLFSRNLTGHPLAARLEPMRPEVRRAIALHGLADDRYFNSGVILFDLTSDRLLVGLDGAVHAIADDETTLLYHDQCALNLGFRSDFADLDNAWNYAVTEETALAAVPPEAAVLHFLARPKPWSAAYGGEAGVVWFDQWRETAALIGEAAAVEIFGLIQD